MKKGYFYSKKITNIRFRYNGEIYDFVVIPKEAKVIQKVEGMDIEITDEATRQAFYFKKWLDSSYLELEEDLVNYALGKFNNEEDPLMWCDIEN